MQNLQTTQTQTKQTKQTKQDRRVLATQRLLWGAQNVLRSFANVCYAYTTHYVRTPRDKGELLAIAVALAKAQKVARELRFADKDYNGAKYLRDEAICTSVAVADEAELPLQSDEALYTLCDEGDGIPLTNIMLAAHYTQTHGGAVFCAQTNMWYSVAEHANLVSTATGCPLAVLQELEHAEGARDWQEFTCHLLHFRGDAFADLAKQISSAEYADALVECRLYREASEYAYIIEGEACDITNGVCRALVDAGRHDHERDFCRWLHHLGFDFATEVL